VRLLVCLALLVSTTVAYADDDEDDDGFTPNHRLSVAVGFAGHGSRVHGETEGGMGAIGELAIGSGRWQYIGEALVGSAGRGDPTDELMHVGGRMLHGGAGLRWIARQFRPTERAGVELFLTSIAGVERFYFNDGGRVTRTTASLGVGMQVRGFKKPRFAIRIDGRVVFFRDSMDSTSPAAPGYMTGFSFAW
jgi:hypothetical protein